MSAAPCGPAPDTLLLDEMFSPVIAERLLARGVDCLAVAQDVILSSRTIQWSPMPPSLANGFS